MRGKPGLSKLLVLGAGTAIVGVGIDAYATTGRKQSCHLYVFGVHELYQVFHDDIDAVLVEITMVAETEKIKFQTLALYHFHVGNVADAYFGKVWLSGNGTE